MAVYYLFLSTNHRAWTIPGRPPRSVSKMLRKKCLVKPTTRNAAKGGRKIDKMIKSRSFTVCASFLDGVFLSLFFSLGLTGLGGLVDGSEDFIFLEQLNEVLFRHAFYFEAFESDELKAWAVLADVNDLATAVDEWFAAGKLEVKVDFVADGEFTLREFA